MKTIKSFFAIALVAISLVTTSCLDNNEPAGIADLRSAKSEYLRAQALVQKAQAALVEAQAAQATAIARQEAAQAAIDEYNAEILKAQSEADIKEIEARLKVTLEQQNAALLNAQAATKQAEQNYLQAIAQLNILKTIGIPEMYKSQYNTVYSRLTAAWSSVNSKQTTLLNNQKTLQQFDAYGYDNQVLAQQTSIDNVQKQIVAAQKALADYKLFNDTTGKNALLTTYEQKLKATLATIATKNGEITKVANELNDAYADLKAKNNAYNQPTLFTYKLAVPAELQTWSGIGGNVSNPKSEIIFSSGANYFNVVITNISQYDVNTGSQINVIQSKVYEYKTPGSILLYSPEYFNQYIWKAQEIEDKNAGLASRLSTMNSKKDSYNGTTNGNLKAWEDAVTAYKASQTSTTSTNLRTASLNVWGINDIRTTKVDAVWNPLTNQFEDKNSNYVFGANINSSATYVAYMSAKYYYDSEKTAIDNQAKIKDMFNAATTALAKIKTDVLAISDPIKTATTNYNTKTIAIDVLKTDRNLANEEKTRYENLMNNLNNGITNYASQINILEDNIKIYEQQKKQYEEALKIFKANPTITSGGAYKEILAADIKNIETQIADLNKEIETYTKQLATLLEYINADNK